jgi:hypothetical protein
MKGERRERLKKLKKTKSYQKLLFIEKKEKETYYLLTLEST